MKYRAIGTIDASLAAALDHHVDLDRREPGGGRGVDCGEHLRHREIDVVHRAKCRIVERIEADRDASEAGIAQAAAFFASSAPLVVRVRSMSPSRASISTRRSMLRRSSGSPPVSRSLRHALVDEDPREARDLLEREELRAREKFVVRRRRSPSGMQ